ncbi:MAG TPA: chromosome segregation protein SMC [Egibacteraceae bacterium]|nr:chromosome segregation protein SMC [Egibacteraceae bacterium]
MFLKSLTLRGFKSFADKTTLDFESGITVVVGPNGSGKSNVVDALAWVLGTYSAKTLRGGQMADVIFAGAPGRAALGRAAVDITIDNTAGTLPIDFSEVTVSRAMFASGESEYAINGTPCRLLDVQELLSDTGLGRENHTIVGQGRLDAVLNARPEERRAFIEEAAGILKHRRRKERSLRKLAALDGHLERLTDVVREVRRNLRPLERQAEAAAKHAELQAALRKVRVARALRELVALSDRWGDEEGAQQASDARLTAAEAALAAARADELAVEKALADLAPSAQAAAETHFRLANLVERYRGLGERIEERRQGLVDAVEEPVAGRDPVQLREQAQRERARLDELQVAARSAEQASAEASAARRAAEHARRAHEQAAAAEARRRSEARERVLRWEGEVSALRSSLGQAASEEGRLASQVSGLRARRDELCSDAESVRSEIQRLDVAGTALAEQLTGAERNLQRRQAAADAAVRRERDLERARASLEARADALRAASQEATEGTQALSAAADDGRVEGIVGPLADHVRVADGMARAVAAALGTLGDALVAASPGDAAEAVGFVRSERLGRVVLLAAAEDAPPPDTLDEPGVRPLAASLHADPAVHAALCRALAGVYVVADHAGDDYAAACRLAERHPDLVFVTRGGELAGARGYAGGSAAPSSAVLSRAAAEQAESQLEGVGNDLLVAHRQVGDADRALAAARQAYDAAASAMQECDGQLTAAAERLGRLRKELETCERELEVLVGQQADLAEEIASQRARQAALEARGPAAQADDDATHGAGGPDLEAERLDDVLAGAREEEVQARLAASAVAQRGDELARRVQALEQEADDVERQLAEREDRRRRRLAAIERCRALTVVSAAGLARAEASLRLAAEERDRMEEARAAQQRELGVVRNRLREHEAAVTELREQRHGEELRRAELRHELDAVRNGLSRDLGLDADAALEEARGRGEELLGGGEARDSELAEAEDRLVRKVALLGTVNPLAQEEFEALEERHRFLVEQIDDLKTTKRDLAEVVAAVDERIKDVFSSAFTDVAAQFERIFPRLFPGGTGRLVLTDPDDLLESGVDVEARPPGKRVKRLSLLSGGERSLTALAVLFAIFAARSSPFYVLDEVEAALDDVNLQRFLAVVSDFRSTSQLIIVTHQTRTMEVADVLYGVSMQAGGVSKVISQRLTEAAPAGSPQG